MSTHKRVAKQVPSLQPLEERLREQVAEVNIIGELSIGDKLQSQLRQAFTYQLQRRSLTGLLRRYPTCFVVHLVAEGIYGYESGNYWGGTPLKKYGSQNDVRKGGQFFESFIDENGLETFPDRTRRYVSLILLHGGIPNDALPDFFEYALYPAVREPGWLDLTSRQLVDRWPEEPPTSYRLTKVVHTFLREGGEVAVDLVARCIDMAEQTLGTRSVPSSKEVRLPQRVVEAFAEWWSSEKRGKRTGSPRRPRTNRASTVPPKIWIEPWHNQIRVDLPKQQFSTQSEAIDLQWLIRSENRASAEDIRVSVHAYRSGEQWTSESESVPLPAPARSYDISLTGLKSARSWSFEGLAPERELLAFDADTRELIAAPQALPARPLWLVYPEKKGITVKEGRKIEGEIQLRGEWDAFTVARWDLSSARSVQVGETTWSVSSQGQGLRPRLVEGEELPLGENRERYYMQLPDVRIPVAPNRNVQDEVSRWELRVSEGTRAGTARPLNEAHVDVIASEQVITLPLDQLIDRIGTYEVGLRGPLGRSASFSFSYVGDSSVHLNEEPRLPREGGKYPDSQIVMRTEPEVKLNCVRDDVEIESSEQGVHNVIFGGTCTQAEFSLDAPSAASPVNLTLSAPGLHWAVRDEDGLSSWTTRPIRKIIDEIEQSTQSELIVRSQPARSSINLRGKVRVYDGDKLVQTIESKSRATGQLRFDLLELLDLLRYSDRALQLQLDLGGRQTAWITRLEASLDVRNIDLVSRQSGDLWNLDVTWDTEGKPVTNRILQLWSKGRPWEPPNTFQIPDEARGEARFQCPVSDLPPGPYLVALDLEDPWTENLVERPPEDASNVAHAHVGSAAERLRHSWKDEASLFKKLEQAFLANSASEASRLFREAAVLITAEDIPLLVRTLWWLGSSGSLLDHFADRENIVSRLIRDRVVESPQAVISALVDSDFREISRSRLQSFMVNLGLPQSLAPVGQPNPEVRDAAWQVWSPLGWMFEANDMIAGKQGSIQRARRTTGVDELIAGESDDDDNLSEAYTVNWKNLESEVEIYGGRLGDQEVAQPAPVLRELQHQLGAALRGHFDDDQSWLAVNFDWLINHKTDTVQHRSELHTLIKLREPLRAGIEDVSESGPVPESIAEAMLNRYDPRPDAELTNVPFCVGATALLQRARALFGVKDPLASTEDLMRCGAAAFTVAQRLYERDLCLISLALAQQVSSE